jgi:hypothetical protein
LRAEGVDDGVRDRLGDREPKVLQRGSGTPSSRANSTAAWRTPPTSSASAGMLHDADVTRNALPRPLSSHRRASSGHLGGSLDSTTLRESRPRLGDRRRRAVRAGCMCGGANGGCLGAELSRLRSQGFGAGAQGCAVGVRDGRQSIGRAPMLQQPRRPVGYHTPARGSLRVSPRTCTEVRNAPRDVGQSLARPIRPGTNRRFGGLRVAE